MNVFLKLLAGMCLVVSLSLSGCIDNVTVDPNSGVATVDFAAQPQDTTTTVKVATVADTPEAPVEVVETPCIEEEKLAIDEEKPVIVEEEKPIVEEKPVEVVEPIVENTLTETEEVKEVTETEEVLDTEGALIEEVEIINSTEINETLENIIIDEAAEEEAPVEGVKAEETPVVEGAPATEEILVEETTVAEETTVEEVIAEETPAKVAEVANEVAENIVPCEVCANDVDAPTADEGTTGEIVGDETINRCPRCGSIPAVVEPVVEESEVIENIE